MILLTLQINKMDKVQIDQNNKLIKFKVFLVNYQLFKKSLLTQIDK